MDPSNSLVDPNTTEVDCSNLTPSEAEAPCCLVVPSIEAARPQQPQMKALFIEGSCGVEISR